MDTVSCQEAAENLGHFLTRVANSQNPFLITGENGQAAVLLGLNRFKSMEETLYLLSHPANAKHLCKSIAELENGRGVEINLADL